MITVVGGLKGGAGKTTIATNLAAINSVSVKTLLVDADPQGSSNDWALVRTDTDFPVVNTITLTGANLRSTVSDMRQSYDEIVIDVGGKDSAAQRAALTIATIFVVPFRPGSYDVWALEILADLISEAKIFNPDIRCLAVLNGADVSGPDNEDALAIAREIKGLEVLEYRIGNRKSFRSSAADGKAVTEWRNSQRKIDHKAIAEVNALYNAIYGV